MISWRVLALASGAAVLALTHLQAYRAGGSVADARQAEARAGLQGQLFDLADRHSQAVADLAALRADQETLLMEFEDAARADPAAASRRPSADSLRRLETLWRGARPAP